VARTWRNRESHPARDAAVRRLSLILLITVLMGMPLIFPALPLAGETRAHGSSLHFACNVGYTPQECQAATTVLRKALARYPAEALGDWRWILVRAEDWKEILSVRRFDTDRPAFSYLPKRETFLDGSLVAGVSSRGMELQMVWHMPIDDLLDLAIRHELAHALCNERDESKTDREAIALKNGMPLSCRNIEQASANSK
jgi:hypothetical protein